MTNRHDANDQLEEIVAYLDGELVGEACARVERRLASDEAFRQQLQSIERAWNALDELPMATVDDRFSRTTMSMVIDAAADDIRQHTRALPRIRRRRWLSTALAGAAAAALGFLVVRLAWHNPNQMLIDDLAVIDHIDIYSQFQDAQFLRLLREELGDELERLSGDAPDLEARSRHFAAVSDPIDGDKFLRSLSDEERTTLRAKLNRFRELTDEEQSRLRSLHAAILTADDTRELQQTLLAYQQWLGGLSPVRQFELRNIADVTERVGKIKTWARQMRDDELLTLSEEQLKEFFGKLREPWNRLLKSLARGGRGGDNREQSRMMSGPEFARLRRELADQFDDRGSRDWFHQAVFDALPEPVRAKFEALPTLGKVDRFMAWMRQHAACRGEVTQAELEHFFAEELNPEWRAQLLALPPGEMEQALRRLYRCQTKSGRDARWGWEPRDDVGDRRGDGRHEDDRGPRGPDGPWPRFGPQQQFDGQGFRPGFGPPLGERPEGRPRRPPRE